MSEEEVKARTLLQVRVVLHKHIMESNNLTVVKELKLVAEEVLFLLDKPFEKP